MCTLSWWAVDHGYHVFANRDERRTRGPEHPPEIRAGGGRCFIAPLDGEAGGTWIAVNDRGLTCCLLNATPIAGPAGEPRRSRGLVPLALAAGRSAGDALSRLRAMPLEALRPFVVVLFEPAAAPRAARWDGARLHENEPLPAPPVVSSSFATGEVRAARGEVYRRHLATARDDAAVVAAHRAFHASHAPRRGPLSPCMHRPDAVTRSFSWVEVDPTHVRFRYAGGPPCRAPADLPPVELPRGSEP